MKESEPAASEEISADELAGLARLSRLRISPAETKDAARAINDILRMMQRLREADISGEDDTSHAQFWGNTLRMREDKTKDGYAPETLLQNAPQSSEGCFVVPKVIE